jgi:iron complex outermembrane receptor protein
MTGSRIVTLMFVVASLLGICLGQSAVSQTTELKGVVTDETKAVIPGAALSLFGQQGRIRDAVSADDGAFSLGELPHGSYRLVVRKEGFADREIAIELDGRAQDSDLVLSTNGVSETVTVVMDSAAAAVESTLKSPLSIHETPRSLSVIGSERIQEQNFRQVSDVLNYVPGTSQNSYRNGSYHFYSRGYRMGPEDTRVDGFAGINVGGGGFGASTFGVEEIVVLRGPASLIYGQTGSPGGLINLITKRPREQYRTQVDLRTMGYQGNGVSLGERPGVAVDADSTGPLFGSERVFYRALASVEQMNYFTKDTLDRNQYVNGSLTFKLDRQGRYLLTPAAQYVRYYRPYGGGIVASPSSSLSASLSPAADPRNVTIDDDGLSPLDVNLFGGRRIEETAWGGVDFRGAVTDKLMVNAAYRYVSFDTDINSFTPQATTAEQITRLRNIGLVDRVQSKSLTERNYNNLNADVSYEWLNNGWFKNTSMVGFYSRILDSRTVSGSGQPQSAIKVYTGSAAAPLADTVNLPFFGIWGRDVVWNTFLQNTTAIDNGRWLVTIGLNYGQNDPAVGAVRKSGLIPNAAIVFNATPEFALYGSYSTSFNPVDPTLQDAAGNIGVFDPTLGKSYEVGAKYDLLNRRVSLTMAAFQNQIENALVQSDLSVLNPNGQRFWIPAGTRRSRGIEMTGDFQVRQDLRVSGGASYTAAIYKGFPGGLTSNGSPPAASPIPNSWAEKTPHWSYNFYTRYDRAEGYLKGFGAGFGMSWQGKRLGSNGARTFASPDPLVLPAFAKADAALFYRLNKFVNFALNVDNVFDELIFVNASVGSAIEVAAPRTLTLRTSFNF